MKLLFEYWLHHHDIHARLLDSLLKVLGTVGCHAAYVGHLDLLKVVDLALSH